MKLKNVDTSLEKIDNMLLKSLCFLDNHNVYISVVFVLFLYNTCLFKNINYYVSELYNHAVVKVLVLLLIIYTARKSYLISLLLAISFLISLNFKTIMENFIVDPLPSSTDSNYATVNDEELSKSNSVKADELVDNTVSQDNFASDSNERENTLESFDSDSSTFLNKKDCMENYPNKNEDVGNLCTPVSTFNNELNAQGLNNIIGYNKQVGYEL